MKACTGDHKFLPIGEDATEYKFDFKTPNHVLEIQN